MRRIPIVIGAVASIGVSSVALGDQLIDFEAFTDGVDIPEFTPITTQFADMGVTFSSTHDDGPLIRQNGFAGQSGINALMGNGGACSPCQPIYIDFAESILSASITALDVGMDGLFMRAFDEFGFEVASDYVSNPGTGYGYWDVLQVSSDAGISRLELRQEYQGRHQEGYLIDDLRWERATPAPGALALLGLAGLAGTRRRRG
jgi:MYXO-CTERM domain-containing protein